PKAGGAQKLGRSQGGSTDLGRFASRLMQRTRGSTTPRRGGELRASSRTLSGEEHPRPLQTPTRTKRERSEDDNLLDRSAKSGKRSTGMSTGRSKTPLTGGRFSRSSRLRRGPRSAFSQDLEIDSMAKKEVLEKAMATMHSTYQNSVGSLRNIWGLEVYTREQVAEMRRILTHKLTNGPAAKVMNSVETGAKMTSAHLSVAEMEAIVADPLREKEIAKRMYVSKLAWEGAFAQTHLEEQNDALQRIFSKTQGKQAPLRERLAF
ncbi:unnamed protein product, partial [Amoebophrya sp. A25]